MDLFRSYALMDLLLSDHSLTVLMAYTYHSNPLMTMIVLNPSNQTVPLMMVVIMEYVIIMEYILQYAPYHSNPSITVIMGVMPNPISMAGYMVLLLLLLSDDLVALASALSSNDWNNMTRKDMKNATIAITIEVPSPTAVLIESYWRKRDHGGKTT